jgi:enoyl-CoA hydratase/carnithine racemase
MLVRLSRASVVSIASIRGRATGVGSELALACDMRFASLERAILSQFEVGAGFVPGGGPMARLPRLIGRGRALEVLLGADDIPGDLAERYGYVNRALPDAELDAFVEALAMRIASFDKQAIVETKNFVNIASLPPDAEIAPEWDACIASLQRPAAQRRIIRVWFTSRAMLKTDRDTTWDKWVGERSEHLEHRGAGDGPKPREAPRAAIT